MPATVGGTNLLVTGEDLSSELSNLLHSLRPQIRVHFMARDEVLASLAAPPVDEGIEWLAELGSPAMVVVAIEELTNTNLGWIRRLITHANLPLIVVVPGFGNQRSALRERVREVGAIDCLLRTELSTPLLEAAIVHARNHQRQLNRLVDLRERFSLAIEGARDGMWEWDLARGRASYSPRWRALFKLSSEDARPILDTWLARVHPQDIDAVRANLDALERGEIPVHECEHRIRDADNEWRWVLSRAVLLCNAEGRPIRMAGSLTDLSIYRQRERALREMSRHDALTQLPDQRVFLERCARSVELARAHNDYAFVVLLIAVDRLAQIRDSFGIDAADRVLALMSKRLRGCLRPEDLLFRFSAGKLAVLLEDVEDASVAAHVANRIHAAVAQPFEIDGATTYTTVSIGMTSSEHGYRRVEEVVTDVSAATDTARARGRNRHEIYDSSMRVETRALLALEMAMREAIDHEQFELHYQPIINLEIPVPARVENLVGFEALLRWEHPELGRLSPAEFIPIAEETGLIIPLGRWVLREAIHTLARWQDEFGLRELYVSVNLSAKQVGDPLLLDAIDGALAETGLAPQCLKIELTESIMMDRVEQVTALLQAIRARGIAIWIDDFGTGYSSLKYLHQFPVDGLKIDRSFVDKLDGSAASETLVRAILGLAENFGLSVVAEGIENEIQAEQLARLGCQRCQGWLFGRPRAADAVLDLLQG